MTGALGRLGQVGEDNKTLLEQINNLGGRLAALDSKDGEARIVKVLVANAEILLHTKNHLKSQKNLHLDELEVRLGEATAELTARLSVLDNEGGAVREKVQQLEDAHTLQVVNPVLSKT